MIASERVDLAAYVEAERRLLAHSGFERTGDPQQARRFRLDHITQFLDERVARTHGGNHDRAIRSRTDFLSVPVPV